MTRPVPGRSATRFSLTRSLPIPVRLLVTIGVPLFALGGVLGVQITGARTAGDQARQALVLAEFLQASAVLQSAVVVPEIQANGLTGAELADAPVETTYLLTYVHDLILKHAAEAQKALDAVLVRHPDVVPQVTKDVFAAQRAALEPVLAGDVSPGALARLAAARARTDDALTDVYIGGSDTSWLTYQAIIELNRTRYAEVSALLPTLSGYGKVTAAQLSVMGGARANAVTRSGFGTDATVRQEIKDILAGPDNQAYLRAVDQGVRIASGKGSPLPPAQVQLVATTALALAEQEDATIRQVQDEAATSRQAEVTAADHRERVAVTVAALVLSVTLVLAAMALRSILVPLRDLTRRAEELSVGQLDGSPVSLAGRDELTRLASALEGSAATLVHVNAQAQAIGDGRFTDPSLRRAAPGAFGAVIHNNVRAVQAQAERLRHDADHDAMTGLLNRAALERVLAQSRPGGRARWLLYLDLDGFKQINDVHGHEQGDDVLRLVSERLRQTVGRGDLVARLGGDEFVVVHHTDEHDERAVDGMVQLLENITCLPIPQRGTGGGTVAVGVSIGWAPLPTNASVDAALARADTQMYAAKRARKALREMSV